MRLGLIGLFSLILRFVLLFRLVDGVTLSVSLCCVHLYRESKSAEVARVWEIEEDRLSLMSARDVRALEDAFGCT